MDIQPDMGAAHRREWLLPFSYSTEFGEDFMRHERKPIERDNEQ